MRWMKKRILALLCCCGMVLPVQAAQDATGHDLLHLLQQAAPAAPASGLLPEQRAAVFSVLGVLPAETDSFLVVRRVSELLACFSGGVSEYIPDGALDSVAVGVSHSAVRDLKRLAPLLKWAAEKDAAEKWMAQASAETALALAAQQRESLYQMGAALVEATRDFHLGPIHVALSCAPGQADILQQLSVLPLMIPLQADGPVELYARGASRGFCVRGDLMDLGELGLAPEHEKQVRENLRQARLYVITQVRGNALLLTLCSNPDEVKLPSSWADSLLGDGKMLPFDACLQHDAFALAHSSADMVNMREEFNRISSTAVPRLLQKVFAKQAPGNEPASAALDALNRLFRQFSALTRTRVQGDQVAVWRQQGDFYVRVSADANGESFAPGSLEMLRVAHAPQTVCFLESTPLKGLPRIDAAAVLADVGAVHKAYVSSLKEEFRNKGAESLNNWQKLRPAVQQLMEGTHLLGGALQGNVALRVTESAAPESPVLFSLRAGVADAAALKESGTRLQSGIRLLQSEQGEHKSCEALVQQGNGAVMLNVGQPCLSLAPQNPVPVEGGAVFSLHFHALSRAAAAYAQVQQTEQAQEGAAHAAAAASYIERVDGALNTRNGQFHLLLRVKPTPAKP